MKRVLIHAMPRSGSKTLQSAVQERLKIDYHDTVMMDNRSIDYGLDEFFINRQNGTSYKQYDLITNAWLLKHCDSIDAIPDGAMWERFAIASNGNIKWELVPAKQRFLKQPQEFLSQQLSLLQQLGDRPYVAKIFTGFGLYNSSSKRLINTIYTYFDTHFVLRRRDVLANFLSRATCRRIGNWSGINQSTDEIEASSRTISFVEFQQWRTAIDEFEERVKGVPNPINLYLEDFTSQIVIPDRNINISLPVRETIEYGERKYQWVRNLDEVKQWFSQFYNDQIYTS